MILRFRLSRKGSDENSLEENGSQEIGGFSDEKPPGTVGGRVRAGGCRQNVE